VANLINLLLSFSAKILSGSSPVAANWFQHNHIPQTNRFESQAREFGTTDAL
jgi:hypothetical protein